MYFIQIRQRLVQLHNKMQKQKITFLLKASPNYKKQNQFK